MSHRAELLLVWSLCCWVLQSSAIDVRADAEVIVEDGATGILNCSFTSSEEVSSATAVTWSFRSNQPDHKYFNVSHTILSSRNGTSILKRTMFKDRLRFIGNISRRDVSIQLSPVQLRDSGSFYCGVRNPPDVYGLLGRIRLRVVQRDEPSTNPPPTGEPPAPLNLVLVSVCVVINIIIVISATVLPIYCNRRSLKDRATGGGGGEGGRGGGGGGGPNTEGVYENICPESERIYQDLRLEDMEPTYSDLQRR